MEIIDALEPVERSVYTGAIGWFGLDGSSTFNIAIRTLIASRGMMHVYAGGGIVADSDPDAEYDETTAKALGMCRALGWEAACGLRPAACAADGNTGVRSLRHEERS
jgi:anthranilate/para-aminobenzoate synthase component I